MEGSKASVIPWTLDGIHHANFAVWSAESQAAPGSRGLVVLIDIS